jgi:tRNA pseudouridine32 synthase/23S rRNA pseudouridine746 synthase/23S rRNA pseudouridine1911/1915/1917 synthase
LYVSRWAEIRAASVILEDEAVLVLDKPAGVSVMGERHETDLVRMAAEEAGETLYPVHRIDKVTSGVVLFAKELRFHGDLTRQFSKRTVAKSYLAVVRGTGLPELSAIDLPLGTGRKNTVRVAGARGDIRFTPAAGGGTAHWSLAADAAPYAKKSYPSLTGLARVAERDGHTLLVARPVTGRRHQLRVHLAWTGHPIEGDPLFKSPAGPAGGTGGAHGTGGARESAEPVRTCLHSWRLEFTAEWDGGRRVTVQAPPDQGFWYALGGTAPDDLDTTLDRALDSLRGEMFLPGARAR